MLEKTIVQWFFYFYKFSEIHLNFSEKKIFKVGPSHYEFLHKRRINYVVLARHRFFFSCTCLVCYFQVISNEFGKYSDQCKIMSYRFRKKTIQIIQQQGQLVSFTEKLL